MSTIKCGATHSKDNPNLPQIKIMTGGLDPLGMPLATEVVSGEKADDVLYIPVIERLKKTLKKEGLLFVSDCKGCGLETRAYISGHGDLYLSPLPLRGNTGKEIENWITEGIGKEKDSGLEKVYKENDKGEKVLLASGYEFERKIERDGKEWTERVFVVILNKVKDLTLQF
jgi:transposase